MASQLFLLPFRPALDANAIVVPDARLHFYASGTSTPQAVYSDEALTTPLSNPVTADAAGAWPLIYLNQALTYRVVIKDADGNTLPNGESDPYIPGVVDALAPEIAADAADARAYATSLLNYTMGIDWPTPEDGVDPVTGVPDGRSFDVVADGTLKNYLNDGGTAVFRYEVLTVAAFNNDGGAANIGTLNLRPLSELIAPLCKPTGRTIAATITATWAASLVSGATFNETGIALTDHRAVLGNNAVIASQSVAPLFTIGGTSPLVEGLYLQGNTDASDFYFNVSNSRGVRIRNIYGANTGFGGIKFAPASDSGVSYLDAVYFEDVTGTGYSLASGTNKIKANGIEAFGKIDYTLGLGKPRAGSVGWRQNTPVIGSEASGGHQIINSNMEALDTGWWLTDAQLTKLSNCLADGTSQYGLRIEGASKDIEVSDFFCGTTAGIYIGGTAQRILFAGLKTLFTGLIPPWGATDFFNGVSTFYDVTVADTASVKIDGDSWIGSKRVSVASGATLDVSGGQRVYLHSETAVTASSTVYLKPGGGSTATESEATFRAEFDGVLFMVRADSNNTPSSGSHVYTVRKAGVDTVLTCSTAAAAFTSRMYHGGLTVNRGDLLSVKLVTASGTTAIHDVFVQVLSL